jgi:hypothetical protein
MGIAEVLELNRFFIEKYRQEADEKTSKLLQAKNLAAMLSDRRKGPALKPSQINDALIALGLSSRSSVFDGGAKRYYYSLTEKGREFGRVGADTPTGRSLEWRPNVLPLLREFFQCQQNEQEPVKTS